MGIHRFFYWFKNTFPNSIEMIENRNKLNKNIDIFIIDLNGIFHNSAQKVFCYGNYKLPPSLLGKRKGVPNTIRNQIEVYKDICNEIELLIDQVNPQKKLVLCVDGPAPFSKIQQQRKRRFKSSTEENSFDQNCITPGTKFMDYLTKYIDWYIKSKINNEEKWRKFDIVFSNEKVPGEGEHTGKRYIHQYGNKDDTYCIHGNDADLIMLSLATHKKNFYILRENVYKGSGYFFIDISIVSKELKNSHMKWEGEKKYNETSAINDFVFLCFLVGNDFLPHIPSIDILSGGIDKLLEIYRDVGKTYGHLTRKNGGNVVFVKKSLQKIMHTIGNIEKEMLEEKLNKRDRHFPDHLLIENTERNEDGNYIVKIKNYRQKYNTEKFGDVKNVVCDYLEGMQWVLSYYTNDVPCWKWCYNYHYAPFAYDIAKQMNHFRFVNYEKTYPIQPYKQLLSVLPPSSSNLLPEPLCNLFFKSELKEYCPDEVIIDTAGKRKEWEGVILVPIMKIDKITEIYNNHCNTIHEKDIKRNTFGKTFEYSYDKNVKNNYKSYYGDILDCNVKIQVVDL